MTRSISQSLGDRSALGEDGLSAQYGRRLGVLLRIPRSSPSPEQRDQEAGNDRPERQAGRRTHELDNFEAEVLRSLHLRVVGMSRRFRWDRWKDRAAFLITPHCSYFSLWALGGSNTR